LGHLGRMNGQARVTSVAEPSLPPQALIALAPLLQRRIRVPNPSLSREPLWSA